MDILRKEYCTRRGRALKAVRIRTKPRGRPVPSDWPPPRRCGQAALAAAGRPYFFYWGGIPPNCADVFIVPVLVRIYSHQGWLVHLHNRLMSDEQKKRLAACLDLCLHVHVHMSTY